MPFLSKVLTLSLVKWNYQKAFSSMSSLYLTNIFTENFILCFLAFVTFLINFMSFIIQAVN